MEGNRVEEKNNIGIQTVTTILGVIIFVGIMLWVIVINPAMHHKEYINGKIIDILNDEYDKVFTSEDVDIEIEVDSDYKPIYRVELVGEGIIYVGLVFPNGQDKAMEYYAVDEDLVDVNKALNQSN